jgi:hypothetical protein
MPNPNSYLIYTGDGSTTDFSLAGIDGWLNDGFIEVYLDGTLQTTGYSINLVSGTWKVQFTTAPATSVKITLKRNTPSTIAGFKSDVVDFVDGSVLTAAALDRAIEGLVHISQESQDASENTIALNNAQTGWDAQGKRVVNMADGLDSSDAVSMGQFTVATLFGGAVTVPQTWSITGTGGTTYSLTNPAPLNTESSMFLVEFGGVIQAPSTYTITSNSIVFSTGKTGAISVRNFGVARNLIASTAIIEDGSITTAKIVDDAVTFAKMQNLSADKIIGTVSAGSPQEITMTGFGRSLVDDASPTAGRATLGLGALSTLDQVDSTEIMKDAVGTAALANGAVTTAKVADAAVTGTKIAQQTITNSNIAATTINADRLSQYGPTWDANGVSSGTVPGAPTTAGTQAIRLNRNGLVEAKSLAETHLWKGYNASGTLTTTIRADGAASASTDLMTKAAFDLLPLYNLDPQTLSATNVGSGLVRVEVPVNSIDTRRLAIVNQTLTVPNTGTTTGTHYIALKNNGATSVKVMVLWGEFAWQNATSGFPTNTASPTNFSLPWTYSLGNFVQGVQTIGAGVTAYFQGSGTGWTGTANTTDSLILTGDTNASVFVKLWILRLN